MKKIVNISLLTLGMVFISGQTKEDSIQFNKISTEILNSGKGYDELRELTKNIGHRLSGSKLMKNLYNGLHKSFVMPVQIRYGFRTS